MITDNTIVAVLPHPPFQLLEECLCHGLLAYHMMMLRSIPPAPRLYFEVGNWLKSTLLQTELRLHWRAHTELRLWISFMGAHTITHGSLRDWFVLLLRGISLQLSWKLWEQIKNILKRFMWDERCGAPGRALWFEVEETLGHDALPLQPNPARVSEAKSPQTKEVIHYL
jgi:hypothetical protein